MNKSTKKKSKVDIADQKIKHGPLYGTILPLILALKDIFFEAKTFFFSPTYKWIIILGSSLLLTPYFIQILSIHPKSKLQLINIRNKFGQFCAWFGNTILILIIFGGFIASNFLGVGTRNAKLLMPQLSWPFYWEGTWGGNGGVASVNFLKEYKGQKDVMHYIIDTRIDSSAYAGWMITFGGKFDLENSFTINKKLSFLIRAGNGDISNLMIGLKNRSGYEAKYRLSSIIKNNDYLPLTNQWRSIEIDLTELFLNRTLPVHQHLENMTFSLGGNQKLEFYISNIRFWN